jgi:ubiquinol-cytochrome c reductase iron-sulfur subunit
MQSTIDLQNRQTTARVGCCSTCSCNACITSFLHPPTTHVLFCRAPVAVVCCCVLANVRPIVLPARAPVRALSSSATATASATPFPISPEDPDSEEKCGYDSVGSFEESIMPQEDHLADPTNRAFTYFIQGSAAVAYASIARAAVHKFVQYLSASADVLALASLEVEIGGIQEGMASTVKWRGKPVFIRHRTAKEIEAARADDSAALRDNESDADRVQKPEWIVVVGVCTHLGCVPINAAGDWGGWFCPCHGSHYDTAGRIRKGPAPLNLVVPQYKFLSDTKVLLG